jgi:hypothetical protein
MNKLEKNQKKSTNKLYIFCIQDEYGTIQKLMHGSDYEQLWLIGTNEAKAMRCYWSMFDIQGRPIDGNFKVVTNK